MNIDMSVNIAGVELKNPVMTASGTFGSGMEYSEFVLQPAALTIVSTTSFKGEI